MLTPRSVSIQKPFYWKQQRPIASWLGDSTMCQKLDSQRVTLKLPQAFYPSFKELLDSPTHEGAKILVKKIPWELRHVNKYVVWFKFRSDWPVLPGSPWPVPDDLGVDGARDAVVQLGVELGQGVPGVHAVVGDVTWIMKKNNMVVNKEDWLESGASYSEFWKLEGTGIH